ncbi:MULTISPECIES: tetratricopeptide repeat protein [Thiorhodovibrio]|uniref:hypothetical protein n=1 Tax=Thiorhodovibrio TaxID=61593 RepID=UPI001914456E|nr:MULTISPECIES: hypothetical protein [Thiorhodovibrio]WPL12012.1 hypothetical protein Thiosp_01765 [Thiorhodovibrio litoralis]
MDYPAFLNSLNAATCPVTEHLCLAALWFDAKGDWNRAHEIVQSLPDRPPETGAARIHAYLHRKEGDLDPKRCSEMKLHYLPCLDSPDHAEARRRELQIPRDQAAALGQSAIDATLRGDDTRPGASASPGSKPSGASILAAPPRPSAPIWSRHFPARSMTSFSPSPTGRLNAPPWGPFARPSVSRPEAPSRPGSWWVHQDGSPHFDAETQVFPSKDQQVPESLLKIPLIHQACG